MNKGESRKNWQEFKNASRLADRRVHVELDDFLTSTFPGVTLDEAIDRNLPQERYVLRSYGGCSDEAADLLSSVLDQNASGFIVGWAPTPFDVSPMPLLGLAKQRDRRFAIAPEDLHLFTPSDLREVPFIQLTLEIPVGGFSVLALFDFVRTQEEGRSWELFAINSSNPAIVSFTEDLRVVRPA